MDVLTIADFGHGGGGNDDDFLTVFAEVDVLFTQSEVELGAGLDVRERAAVIDDFVAVVAGKDDSGNKQAEEECEQSFHVAL